MSWTGSGMVASARSKLRFSPVQSRLSAGPLPCSWRARSSHHQRARQPPESCVTIGPSMNPGMATRRSFGGKIGIAIAPPLPGGMGSNQRTGTPIPGPGCTAPMQAGAPHRGSDMPATTSRPIPTNRSAGARISRQANLRPAAAARMPSASLGQGQPEDDAGKQSGSCRKRVAGEANRTPQRGCTSRRRPLCSGHPSSAGVP